MTDMAKRASRLVRDGFAIFPIHTINDDTGRCSCNAPSCHSPAKHPIASLAPQGVKNATLDSGTVAQWWSIWPDANIGIAAGEVSDIIVIDVDNTDVWLNLQNQHGSIPDTWMAETGGGGYHVYFCHQPGIRNMVGVIPGIDVRSDGGHVVAPPSLHASGQRYKWIKGHSPATQGPAIMPDWLVTEITGVRQQGGSSRPLPDKITEGGRNDLLASAAGVMRRKNFSFDAVKAALLIENRLRCEPPLDDDEVVRIVRSVDRYPAENVPTITFGRRR